MARKRKNSNDENVSVDDVENVQRKKFKCTRFKDEDDMTIDLSQKPDFEVPVRFYSVLTNF